MDKEKLYIRVVKPLNSMYELDMSDNPYLKEGIILVYNGIYIPENEDNRNMMFSDVDGMETDFFSMEKFNRLMRDGLIEVVWGGN